MRPIQQLLFVFGFALVASGDNGKDTLGLSNGYTSLSTSNFDIKLVKDSQTLASLKPRNVDFDFLPFDDLVHRAADGQYHNGDVTFRYRESGATTWISADSSTSRKQVKQVSSSAAAVAATSLAAADLSATLPSEIPFRVIRSWSNVDGDLGLAFTITNRASRSMEIGSLGFPTEFNSIFTNRPAEEMAAKCSLTDPYIGMDAGYLQVTPTSGTGAALIVTPLTNTSTPLEAWRNLDEPSVDPLYYGSQTFEGFYEWQTHSKAFAENEWAGVTPWNRPSSRMLKPGQSVTYGLRFSLVKEGIRDIEKTVEATNTPVVVGIPGYVIPTDLTARLFVLHGDVAKIVSDGNAFKIAQDSKQSFSLTPTSSAWGRTKVTITYTDGKVQTVHYFITDSAPAVISQLGQFTTTSMWFDDTTDPFGRAPSVMTWDHSLGAKALQDPRVWISGLSDEGGVIYLASAMKQFGSSAAEEMAKLETFAKEVLSTRIQNSDFTVRKSLFYYEPSLVPGYRYDQSINWGNWWSWNKDAAYSTDRAYDYIHVIGAYWALYRAGRADESLLTIHPWKWYLSQAYNTTMVCFTTDPNGNGKVGYSRLGLMGETVVGELLTDLHREGWTREADEVEAAMKIRAMAWNAEAVPYGSEMAWDSTGQEGIYYWSNYFKLAKTATKTINSIIGYMPTVAHWGWNGNARRYWDFMHRINLARYSQCPPTPLTIPPDSPRHYLLRVGYGGITGPLSNIRRDGSMYNGFHSFPDTLRGDDYSGDFGPTFLGMMLGAGVYVVNDADLGLVTYGGNMRVSSSGDLVTVQPRDAIRRRVYIADWGVYVTISAGWIDEVSFHRGSVEGASLTLHVVPGPTKASSTVIWVETPGTGGTFRVTGLEGAVVEEKRGGWQVTLGSTGAQVVVSNH
ncbi:hypothetical protein POX_d05584 [Penicillium oxalicum]|uniref:hypothetical protein n=1 Tax=Penicillium oxalicum TaxID=69781 RepID=UPI0020B63CA5|nr:hypothetical protein POX_d05584 [Penicillium oxalicum]KAI2790080.1 hypothetical protein POX_d05584 [Penicillium oxalicum]